MRICGIDYNGSDLVPVVIESGDDGHWVFVPTEPKKLTLEDIFDTDEVRLFSKAVRAFLQDSRTDLVVIKTRARKGKFAGGAASFRMGAVVQLATERAVEFIAPQAISRVLPDDPHPDRTSLLQYQRGAFDVALAYALKNTT